ncbi:MAG: hypothetical protein WBV82_33280, partial [Myxococcaceae bacterium]
MPFASLFFTLIAYVVLRGLWTPVRARRGTVLYWIAAALIHLGYFAARSPEAGVFTTITQGLLTSWFVAALAVVFAGTPLRLAMWVRGRTRRTQAATAP